MDEQSGEREARGAGSGERGPGKEGAGEEEAVARWAESAYGIEGCVRGTDGIAAASHGGGGTGRQV